MKIVLLLPLIILMCSCASIVSKNDYPVTITSEPPGTHFIIKQDRLTIAKGLTPSTITLSASEGYFNPANYRIFHDEKIHALNAGIDGWWIGNLLFSPIIGGLIIDPATGNMWKLPKRIVLNNSGNIPIIKPKSNNRFGSKRKR